ncbi:MAG: VWA domain-containing protein [Dehalococcoidia bacterium]|nr:VWA domain-containing protein [Dehalococcoidia bacterium]MCB9485400.1 VWA domain-containing protein [Thermoflexaceae bacterium]
MSFAEPAALLLALLAVPVGWVVLRFRPAGVELPSLAGLRALRPGPRVRLARFLPLVRIPAIVLLAIAAAGPRVGDANAVIPADGIDIALAIDTSSSMDALLASSRTRIAVTRDVVREFIRGRENDRIGVVAFASTSVALSPPTLDYRALDTVIADLETGFLPDGTAIGLGISEGLNMLRDSPAASRAVILLTDGQHNEPSLSPEDATDLAIALRIRLYTIGVVTPGRGGGAEVDAALLTEIAERTGGRYFEADTPEELAAVYEEIGSLEKSSVGRERFERFTYLAPWFVIPAAALLLGEIALRGSWLRRLSA